MEGVHLDRDHAAAVTAAVLKQLGVLGPLLLVLHVLRVIEVVLVKLRPQT